MPATYDEQVRKSLDGTLTFADLDIGSAFADQYGHAWYEKVDEQTAAVLNDDGTHAGLIQAFPGAPVRVAAI